MFGDRMSKSKRKGSDISDEKTKGSKKRKGSSEDEDLYKSTSTFNELLQQSGLLLRKGSKQNILNSDQAVFQRNLSKALKRHENYPGVIDEFVEGFQDYIEDLKRFHYSLLPTITATDCDSARSKSQDCLVRLMLGVDMLQPKLMKCLLEKLAEFMEEDCIYENGEKVNLPRMLMSQFRWLDRIVNGKEVTEKMLEIIGIVSLDIQREIITCLPDVVEDSEHADVATALRDLLLENNQLTVPILDALSNLTLKPELLSEVRTSVIQTLVSVEMEDLPVVIKFLLQSVIPQDALEVVSEIRNNLDFNSSFEPTRSSTPHHRKSGNRQTAGETSRDSESLTLDAIKSGIRFQKCVAEAWIKAIDAVKNVGDHKVVDIFVLLILHSTNRKKPVESLIRNKIRSGGITEVLIQAAFGSHSEVMRDYFPSILSLAETLLRSPEPAVTYIACAMYKNAFTSFDTFCQQEIVGTLVTHIGSGFEGEIDSSLDILVELVEYHLTKMAPFAIFVKGVLDYLDNLSVTQIRKLYSVLSVLAFRNPQDGGLIQDDLHIIIRKQLSNNDPKYRRMGVIGAIMIVKSIAISSTVEVVSSQTAAAEPITDEQFKQVVGLLQLVRTSCSRMPEASALFMDELCNVISNGRLDPKVEEWINDNMILDFQDDYVNDNEDAAKVSTDVPSSLQFGLDDDSDGAIHINLLPLIEACNKEKKNQKLMKNESQSKVADPICLSPNFRLLRVVEQRQNNGDLENIDALLGCAIFMPKEEVFEKIESLSQKEKETICVCLFDCINWFREIVNGFANQTDAEMKAKVITRLQNIITLQKKLEKCLAVTKGFKPPPANFDWYDCPSPSISMGTTVGGGGGEKKKKKGKKTAKSKTDKDSRSDSDESSRDSSMLPKDTQMDSQIEDKLDSADTPTVDISLYKPFFRELDISVFSILHTGVITNKVLDTDMHTKDTTNLSIEAGELQFLLEDLTRKLNHSLLSSSSKKRTFLKVRADKKIGFSHLDQLTSKEIAAKSIKLLPALCNHLEAASGFFQALTAENDGLIDGPGSSTPEAQLISSCFHLLLQSLLSIFSWNGFLMNENRGLLKEGLTILVYRIKSSTATQISYQDLIKSSFQYIENFSNTVPNLSAAVTLIKLLICLSEKSDSDKPTEKIAKVSEGFLKREWLDANGEREKGAKHNENLQIVIKSYLVYSADPLAAQENIATKGIPELLETDKNGYSESYPTLTRSSYSVYYRVLFYELIEHVKSCSSGKQSDCKEVKLEKLLMWNQAVRILYIFVNLIKAFDGRANLGAALKYGKSFIEIFLRQGMPLMDHMFRSNREDVQGLLKNLQLSTRALHHMCGHSKIVKDLALTNQVPYLKKCLEAFVYRVKAMLTMNKCLEAFWLGNLKNRNLQGDEILSQSLSDSISKSHDSGGEEEDEGDATVPDDDEESDVELDNQSEVSNEKTEDGSNSETEDASCSEVF